jgi:hypothetical protein
MRAGRLSLAIKIWSITFLQSGYSCSTNSVMSSFDVGFDEGFIIVVVLSKDASRSLAVSKGQACPSGVGITSKSAELVLIFDIE